MLFLLVRNSCIGSAPNRPKILIRHSRKYPRLIGILFLFLIIEILWHLCSLSKLCCSSIRPWAQIIHFCFLGCFYIPWQTLTMVVVLALTSVNLKRDISDFILKLRLSRLSCCSIIWASDMRVEMFRQTVWRSHTKFDQNKSSQWCFGAIKTRSLKRKRGTARFFKAV